MATSRPDGRDPRRRALAIAWAIAAGVGLFLIVYAEVPSYLTDAPEACRNCHVMRPQYAAWQQSAHATAAVCNDCHTPGETLPKLTTKARSGLAHAWAFTTGRFPDVIRIQPHSLAIAETNCRRCHATQAESMRHGGVSRAERECTFCHVDVGHAD